MEDEMEVVKSNGTSGMVEEAPFYATRVNAFLDRYEPCGMDAAEEFFDDIKLRDFFGCEAREFTTDGLKKYREELISLGFVEKPCPWLHGKLCFPVRGRWEDIT